MSGLYRPPCWFCGLPVSSKCYTLPGIEIRDTSGQLLEQHPPGPCYVCEACDRYLTASDEPGLTRQVLETRALFAGEWPSPEIAERVQSRHQAFLTTIARHQAFLLARRYPPA
jgi:hypothetical protein